VSSAITGLAFAAAATDSYVGGLTISGFKGTAIAATNAKVTVQANTLSGNKTGISLSASPDSLIGGSEAATGNMLSGNTVGIALSGACTGTVVDRNTLNGNATGVSLSNATGVQVGVVGNTIVGSTRYGVQAVGGLAGSFVQANAITGTTLYGVFLNGAANLLVTGNTITDGKPQGAGMYAIGTLTNTLVQGNAIRNNRGSGVLLDNARGITIGLTAGGAGVANTIVNNSGFGLRALGVSTGSAVRKNIISGNNVNVQISAAKGLVYVP
jgi:parallel beta-helix repeat protein